jgi:hypothetical protein
LSEGAEDDVDDALGGLDVAGGYGTGRAGVDDGALGQGEGDGAEAAVVGGDAVAARQGLEEATDAVVNGGTGDGCDGVDGGRALGG